MTNKKTTVVNVWGGPGAGKSTLQLKLSAYLKENKIDVHPVSEYVKGWIFEGRKILETDQVYFLAKQHRSEKIAYGKVDYIITDCPMWMSIPYEKELTKAPYIAESIINKYLSQNPEVEHKHVLVLRPDDYDPVGRRQTEDEAIEFDQKFLHPFLKEKFGENLLTFKTGEYTVEEVAKALKIK